MSPLLRPRRSSFVWIVGLVSDRKTISLEGHENRKGFESKVTLKIGDFMETCRG